MNFTSRQRLTTAAVLGFAAAMTPIASADYVDAVTAQSPLFYWRMNDAAAGPLAVELDNSVTANSSAAISERLPAGAPTNGGPIPGLTSPALAGPAFPGFESSNSFFNFDALGSGTFISNLTDPKGTISSTLGSVSYWVNSTATGTNQTQYRVDQGATGSLFTSFESGNLRLQIANGSGDSTILAQIATVNDYSDGAWHHVAATWDEAAGQVALYVDGGVLAGGETVTGLFTDGDDFVSSNRNQFGKGINNASLYNGLADELAIWTRALSSAEVAAQYNAATAIPEPATLGLLGVGGLTLIRRRRRS